MRVLVVEDHPIYFEGFKTLLRQLDPRVQTASAESGEVALALCSTNTDFDLCVVDLTLPGMDGATLIESLAARDIWFPVVVISADEDIERIARAMTAGALGFIPKSSDTAETLYAVRQVLGGNNYLPDRIRQQMARIQRRQGAELPRGAALTGITPRQYRVLQLIADGLSNAQIASALNVTEHTVKSHVRGLFQALGADNRTACVHAAIKKGLIGNALATATREPVHEHP